MRKYTASVRAAAAFHWEINELVTLDLAWETYIGTKKIKDTFHRGTGNLAIKLMDGLAVSIAGIYDRVESPVRGQDQKLPKKDDAKVILGLSIAL